MDNKKVYEKTLELFKGCCAICGNPNVQLHHIVFGSLHGTRANLTYLGNIIPLCEKHHREAHKNKLNEGSILSMNNLKEIVKKRLENEDNS